MRKHLLRLVREESGAASVYAGLVLLALLSFFTIAVDFGLWLNTRSEAQRSADAAALAGAGVFMGWASPLSLADEAEDTARYFAAKNYVGRTRIDGSAVAVEVDPDSQSVTVEVEGSSAPIFAWLIGADELFVRARATARVLAGDAAKCLKPFALPDLWDERDQDTDSDRFMDANEDWTYDSRYDRYGKWMPSGTGLMTGLGSNWRDSYGSPSYTGDLGRTIFIKLGSTGGRKGGKGGTSVSPGNFQAWQLPTDATQTGSCGSGGGGGGATAYSRDICTCNKSEIVLGQAYKTQPGNMQGPTKFGIDDLLAQDPDARWDETTSRLISSQGINSPRVVKVALFDPALIDSNPNARETLLTGRDDIVFNNIGLFFVEGYDASGNVKARFLKYADGSSAGGSGSLIKILQLVK